MIELTLAEDIPEIAKSGDTILLKDDKTFEIQNCNKPKKKIEKELEKGFAGYTDFADCTSKNKDKSDPDAYCGSIKNKVEDTKKEYDPRIEKYLSTSIDKEKSWELLTKFYKNGHLDSYVVLKDFINKIAICPDVTDKFEKIMDGWMKDGEADTSSIEKIIDSCKREGGNVVIEGDDKKAKSESIVKEILNLH